MGKIRIELNGVNLQDKDFPVGFREEIRYIINPQINTNSISNVENPFAINVTDLVLIRKAYDACFNWRASGRLFEGIPIKFFQVIPGQQDFLTVDGMIDLTVANWGGDKKEITVKVIESGGIDWMRIMERNTTFERIAASVANGGLGLIGPTDYVYNPYIISTIPNWREALLALVFFIDLLITLIDVIQQLIRLIVKLLNVFEWTTFLQIIVFIAYLITLIILMVETFKMIVSFIIQPIKYHAGMTWKRSLEVGCEALGLKFASGIFNDPKYANELIIPTKNQQPQDNRNDLYGFFAPDTDQDTGQQGFFDGTVGDLFDLALARFNARRFVTTDAQGQKTVRMVRKDQQMSTSGLIIGKPYRKETSNPNTTDLKANTFISFRTDINDLNTVEEFLGTVVEVNERPSSIQNPLNLLAAGDKTVQLPLALGKIKTRLTFPEQLIVDYTEVIEPLLNAINELIEQITTDLNDFLASLEDFESLLDFLGFDTNISQTINNIGPGQAVGLGVIFGVITGSPSGGAISAMTTFVHSLAANFVFDEASGQQVGLFQFPNVSADLEGRIGMLIMENDWVSVRKLIRIVPANQSADIRMNENQPTAIETYADFYFIDSFVPTLGRPNANQGIIETITNVRFTCKDFVNLSNNYFFTDQDGNLVELLEPTEFNPFGLGTVDKLVYKRSELHTPGLIQSIHQGEHR